MQQERGKAIYRNATRMRESLYIEVQQEQGKVLYRSPTRTRKGYI